MGSDVNVVSTASERSVTSVIALLLLPVSFFHGIMKGLH